MYRKEMFKLAGEPDFPCVWEREGMLGVQAAT